MKAYDVVKVGMGVYEGPFMSKAFAQSFIDGQLEDFEFSGEGQTGMYERPEFEIHETEDKDLDPLDCVDSFYAEFGNQVYM